MDFFTSKITKTPLDHAALIDAVEALCKEFPDLSFNYLGNSILGRGIPLLSLGHGKRQVLYVGAHHGMEWLTSTLLLHFLGDLLQALRKKQSPCGVSARMLTEICSIHVIPMLNPDGVEYQIHGVGNDNPIRERLIAVNGGEDFSHWQANSRGIDLNHNYNADFWEYKRLAASEGIDQAAPTRFPGERPESEPEVAALCKFIRYHAPISGLLTLHTQGEEIYPGNNPTQQSRAIADRLSKLCGYRVAAPEGLASMSGLTDWCTEVCKIPSFTLECGRGENPLPISAEPSIYHILRKALFCFPTLV